MCKSIVSIFVFISVTLFLFFCLFAVICAFALDFLGIDVTKAIWIKKLKRKIEGGDET